MIPRAIKGLLTGGRGDPALAGIDVEKIASDAIEEAKRANRKHCSRLWIAPPRSDGEQLRHVVVGNDEDPGLEWLIAADVYPQSNVQDVAFAIVREVEFARRNSSHWRETRKRRRQA